MLGQRCRVLLRSTSKSVVEKKEYPNDKIKFFPPMAGIALVIVSFFLGMNWYMEKERTRLNAIKDAAKHEHSS